MILRLIVLTIFSFNYIETIPQVKRREWNLNLRPLKGVYYIILNFSG
jgi:hypothetical protein